MSQYRWLYRYCRLNIDGYIECLIYRWLYRMSQYRWLYRMSHLY